MHSPIPDNLAIKAAALERRIVDFLSDRLAVMGATDSGLYNYYSELCGKGRAYTFVDVPIADFLLNSAPRFTRYIDVGAGMGQLSALLLSSGLNAIPVEIDGSRFQGLKALLAYLDVPNEAILGEFPTAARHVLASDSLVICSGLCGADPKLEDMLISGALKCGGAVIDLSRFGHLRNVAEEREELNRKLHAAGLVHRQTFLDRASYCLSYYESQKS